MKTKNFSFELPPELIAQYPAEHRAEARLMVLERRTGRIEHRQVSELSQLLPPRSLLVLNDSKVRKARVIARREDSGTEIEILFVSKLGDERWLVTTNKAKRQRVGTRYTLPGAVSAEVVELRGSYRVIVCSPPIGESYFEQHGHVPLPPYIERGDEKLDAARYQTVFSSSRTIGSIAAPTAGLHFTEELLKKLQEEGHETAFVTLHVGLGTFRPVRTEEVEDHEMHEERFSISADAADAVNRAREANRPIVAVGTTSVRSLESAVLQEPIGHASSNGDGAGQEKRDEAFERIEPGEYATRLFIYPGFRFRIVTSMFTNFHTPRSSLLMLVAAFAGHDSVLHAYRTAVAERYRFYSYGDAMFIRE